MWCYLGYILRTEGIALLPVNGRDDDRKSGKIPGNFTVDEAVDLCQKETERGWTLETAK